MKRIFLTVCPPDSCPLVQTPASWKEVAGPSPLSPAPGSWSPSIQFNLQFFQFLNISFWLCLPVQQPAPVLHVLGQMVVNLHDLPEDVVAVHLNVLVHVRIGALHLWHGVRAVHLDQESTWEKHILSLEDLILDVCLWKSHCSSLKPMLENYECPTSLALLKETVPSRREETLSWVWEISFYIM